MIHRFWCGPSDPPMAAWTYKALSAYNPTERVVDWTDETLPVPMRELADKLMDRARPDDAYRHRANVVRLLLLAEFGGAWYDHDLIPLCGLTVLPKVATASHRGTRCNCFLRFPAGHPVIATALAHVVAAPASATRPSVALGERLIDRVAGDVDRLYLPIDSDGRPNPDARAWAVHLHATSSAWLSSRT